MGLDLCYLVTGCWSVQALSSKSLSTRMTTVELARATLFIWEQPRYHYILIFNWHKCAAFQRSAFGRSTAGNDVVATILIRQKRTPHSLTHLLTKHYKCVHIYWNVYLLTYLLITRLLGKNLMINQARYWCLSWTKLCQACFISFNC